VKVPPITPRNILIAVLIGLAIFFVMLLLPGGRSHSQCWEGECWDARSLKPTPSFCGIIPCER
jgi:hypothetical protein